MVARVKGNTVPATLSISYHRAGAILVWSQPQILLV